MRKTIFKIVLILFSLIGAMSLIVQVYVFVKSENEASLYKRNCAMIKVGMTLTDAKKIMGDFDWFRKRTRSEIWVEHTKANTKPEFYLSYPANFGASEWPMIYFDPNTMTVTKVICSD